MNYGVLKAIVVPGPVKRAPRWWYALLGSPTLSYLIASFVMLAFVDLEPETGAHRRQTFHQVMAAVLAFGGSKPLMN